MSNNYFVTVEINDNKFVGIVYNKNNNTKLYTTQRHALQHSAIEEANMYLRTNSLVKEPVTVNLPQTTKRCCGR